MPITETLSSISLGADVVGSASVACADGARVTPEARPARRTGVVPTGPVDVIFIELALEYVGALGVHPNTDEYQKESDSLLRTSCYSGL